MPLLKATAALSPSIEDGLSIFGQYMGNSFYNWTPKGVVAMRTKVKIIWLALAALVTCSVIAPAVNAETVRIGAGPVPYDEVLKPVKEPFEKATGVQLSIKELGVDWAANLQELDKGMLDALTLSIPFEDFLNELRQKGQEPINKKAYQATAVPTSPISVLLNAKNPVKKLSKSELKAILTGKIRKWEEMGGNDESIKVVVADDPPTLGAIRFQIMDGDQITAEQTMASGLEDMRNKVSESPGAVAFGPASLAGDGVKSVEAPEISEVVVIVTKGAPSLQAERFIEFLRSEGHKQIKKTSF